MKNSLAFCLNAISAASGKDSKNVYKTALLAFILNLRLRLLII